MTKDAAIQAPPADISVVTKCLGDILSYSAPAAAPITPARAAGILSFGIAPPLSLTLTYNMKTADREKTDSIAFRIKDRQSASHAEWNYNPMENTTFLLSWEGKHITKRLMANYLALHGQMNCRHIEATFVMIGAYAFARYGFIPHEYDCLKLRRDLKAALPALSSEFGLSAQTRKTLEDIAADGDRHALWRLVDMPEEARGKKLAFRIIREKLRTWNGAFDMNNPEQVARARAYIGADIFDAAMENARRVMAEKEFPAPAVIPEPRPLPAQG